MLCRYHTVMGSLNLTIPEEDGILPMNLLINITNNATNNLANSYNGCFEGNNNSILLPDCNLSLICDGTFVGGECIVSYQS